MDEQAVRTYITETFDGVHVMEAAGDWFFVYDPDRDLPPERQMPFATVITQDHPYDAVSNLDRDAVYRLNIGLTRDTYRALLGTPPTERGADGLLDTGADHTVLDTVIPHPIYASQHWISILNPSTTWPTAQAYLAEAHQQAARKHANYRARRDTGS